MSRFFYKPLLFLNVVTVIFTFFSYTACNISPDNTIFFLYFGIAYPWLLLANLVFIFFWLFKRKWYLMLSLACLAIGYDNISSFIGIHFLKETPASGSVFEATTINVGGMLRGKVSKEEVLAKLEGAIKQYDSDVICLQEIVSSNNKDIKGLSAKHPYFIKTGSMAILSKHPILNEKKLPFAKQSNGAMYADIYYKGETLRIYCVHLHSNQVTKDADEIINDPELVERETYSQVENVLGKVGQAARVRAKHAELLAEHIKEAPYRFLVCGDFNDTPQSYTYATISRGLNDTFKQSGFGIGTTFGGSIPALRIDYILASPTIEPLSCKVDRSDLSDHYPVTSRVWLGK
jgi:endonuclease/exonuclease/phosphatase family metal-dependent hydrolase